MLKIVNKLLVQQSRIHKLLKNWRIVSYPTKLYGMPIVYIVETLPVTYSERISGPDVEKLQQTEGDER